MIKKVQAWQASDGKKFSTRQEAEQYDREISMYSKLCDLFVTEGLLRAEEAAEIVFHNRNQLMKIFLGEEKFNQINNS